MIENNINVSFNENFIKNRLIPFESQERIKLDDDCFVKSAILFLIIDNGEKPYDLVLIRRTKRENDKHSGEMSFPGGKFDPKFDKTLKDTALRECEEEVGIPKEKINILGSFDDHITPKGFIITPIVGYIPNGITMKKQKEEVQEIVKIPISFFLDKKNYRERTYKLKNDIIAVGKFIYRTSNNQKYVIFGATSHLITHFIQMVYGIRLMAEGARRLTCKDIHDKIAKRDF
ncbi:MAG: NUDIX hydrolase [Promethearchaeota archaeon]